MGTRRAMSDDAQDQAELLDEDKVVTGDDYDGDTFGDALSDYPPERPLGVNTVGVTPVEEDAGESFEERTWREEPDPAVEEVEGIEREVPGQQRLDLVEPDASTLDDEEQQIAELADDDAGPEAAALHLEPDR